MSGTPFQVRNFETKLLQNFCCPRRFIHKPMRFDFRLANLIGFHNYLYYIVSTLLKQFQYDVSPTIRLWCEFWKKIYQVNSNNITIVRRPSFMHKNASQYLSSSKPRRVSPIEFILCFIKLFTNALNGLIPTANFCFCS